jgi:glycosyltransferase
MECLIAAPPREIEQLGPLPPSARALGPAPLHLVLPYCDAIVHQGGDGTALTAATAAIPQLVIAASPEADMAGGRISAAGAGIYLRYETHTLVSEAVQKLLTVASFYEGAEIESQPAPAEVVTPLTELVAHASVGR